MFYLQIYDHWHDDRFISCTLLISIDRRVYKNKIKKVK